MAEEIVSRYKKLFEIHLLHHYWLDEGVKLFDTLTEEAKEKRLQSYDCRRFFVFEPTAGTEKTLHGLGAVFKATALGCFVAVPEHIRHYTDFTNDRP